MRYICFLAFFCFSSSLLCQSQSHLKLCPIPSNESFRGISAVSEDICWVSGSAGQVFKTLDGGHSWLNVSPADLQLLQFRDVEAFNADTAYILSAGSPGLLLFTINGGKSWQEVFRNDAKTTFYDALDFYDNGSGVFFGDATDTLLPLVAGQNQNWSKMPDSLLPAVRKGQGGFAASGSCLQAWGDSNLAIVLGGDEATFLLSRNRGKSWFKTRTALDFGEPTKGNFSLAIINDSTFVVAGGDYRADSLTKASVAISADGGKNWELLLDQNIQGRYFSSVVAGENGELLLVSRFNCFYRPQKDYPWQQLNHHFMAADRAPDGSIWVSGSSGDAAYFIK